MSLHSMRAALGVAILAVAAWGCAEEEAASGPDFEVIGGAGGGGAGGGAGGVGGGAGGVGGGAGGVGGGQGGAGGGVNPNNNRPQLKRIGDKRAPVGEELAIQLEAEDPDGDPLSFNVRSVLPDGAKFEKGPGLFTWTPTPQQEGVIALITFEVSDGTLKDQETIQITVTPAGAANAPPEFEPLSDTSLVAGQAFELQLVATDPDGDPVFFGIRGDELPGALLDADSGMFSWTPGADLIGESYNVTFTASDGEAEATADVILSVRDGNDPGPNNLPPRITPIGDQTVTVGMPYQLVIEAEDETPDRLSFGVAGALPMGASFDAPTATFQWTPQQGQANQAFAVVFQVSDGEFRAVERVNFQVQAGGGGGEACVPDPAEDEAGEPLLLMDGARLQGRTICPAGDRDTFAFDVPEGGGFDFRVDFDTQVCDLDLIVEGPDMMQVGASVGFVDTERVARDGLAAGRYTARVYGVGCTSPGFDVAFDLVAEPACQDDEFDAGAGNDDEASATPIDMAAQQVLQICAGDVDHYALDLMVGERVEIIARFSHAMGDIDMVLQGPRRDDGTRLRLTAGSVNDDETILIESVTEPGRYVLVVEGFNNAENSYALNVNRMAPRPCDDDRLEANDNNSVGQAEGLQPELYRNLTWCGDDDWQRTQTDAGDLVQIYITYDEAAPEMVATNAQGQPLEGFVYRPAQGNGCTASGGRDGCHVLEGESAGGLVHYVVRAGVVGQGYDLRVRVTPDNTCNEDVVRCGALEVCDYDSPACAEALCDRDGDCPGGFTCLQDWCVEACENDIDCLHPSHVCKAVEGEGRCAIAGAGRVGAGCFDLTDCAGSFECLSGPDVPGGYCTRQCDGNAECGEGICAQFTDGRFCGLPCQGDGDCRVGYACTVRVGVVGQDVRVCTPIE